MIKMRLAEDRCKQCGLCVANCPRQALSFGTVYNKGGYQVVTVDETKCVKCALCYMVCPDMVFEFVAESGEEDD